MTDPEKCALHVDVPLEAVQLTRGDGQPMLSPLMLCPVCEAEADDDLNAFLDRVRTGDFDD